MPDQMEKVVVPDVIKSLIMPSVTVEVPMPKGAATPGRPHPVSPTPRLDSPAGRDGGR
jgi:hypothetical protein